MAIYRQYSNMVMLILLPCYPYSPNFSEISWRIEKKKKKKKEKMKKKIKVGI